MMTGQSGVAVIILWCMQTKYLAVVTKYYSVGRQHERTTPAERSAVCILARICAKTAWRCWGRKLQESSQHDK